MKNSEDKNQIDEEKILEDFRKQRKDMTGAGGIFESFFKGADPDFVEGIERLVVRYSKVAISTMTELSKASKDSELRKQWENAFKKPKSSSSSNAKYDENKEEKVDD